MNPDIARVSARTLTAANPQYAWLCQGRRRGQGTFPKIAVQNFWRHRTAFKAPLLQRQSKALVLIFFTQTTKTTLTKPGTSRASACQGSISSPDNKDNPHGGSRLPPGLDAQTAPPSYARVREMRTQGFQWQGTPMEGQISICPAICKPMPHQKLPRAN